MDYNRKSNIYVIWVLKGEEKEGIAEKVLEETMAKNFPNMAKDMNLHIQESE